MVWWVVIIMARGQGWSIRYDQTAKPPKWSCKEICKRLEYPIKILLNSQKKRAKLYTRKHKELGRAKCSVCEYITADKMPRGSRCRCCKSLLSTSLWHGHKDKEGNNNNAKEDVNSF